MDTRLILLVAMCGCSSLSPSRNVVLSSDCATAMRTRNVCYALSVSDTGSNGVVVALQIVNHTGHAIALRKHNLQDPGVGLIGDDFEIRAVIRELSTTGPEDYVVLKASRPVFVYTTFERARFERARFITVKKGIAGFLGDMRQPVYLEIAATYRKAANNSWELMGRLARPVAPLGR